MRLGTCLLYEGHTLQGAPTKLAYFCSAPVAGFYAAVDIWFVLDEGQKIVRVLAVFFGAQDHIRHMLVRLLDDQMP